MELISIIPGFQPKNDGRLLKKAEALRPTLRHTPPIRPLRCRVNGEDVGIDDLRARPLRRGDQAALDFGGHVVGRLTLALGCFGSHQDAPAYLRVDLAETEAELNARPEEYHGWLSRSWIQREECHLDTLPAVLPLPRRYAFRYVRLTVLDTSPKYQLLIQDAFCVGESAADESAVTLLDALPMATPYTHHYYVMALLAAGRRDLAEAHIKEYWGGMLRAGADTFWECFQPEDLSASPYGGIIVNSHCHAWSCTPAYIIRKFLLTD